MQFFSIALIFRYTEVIIDCLNLGLYYGSNTQFMLPKNVTTDCYTTASVTSTSIATLTRGSTTTTITTTSSPTTTTTGSSPTFPPELIECFDSYQAGDGFGEFVLIGGFILAVIVLALCIVLEADKKYSLFLLGYNGVFFVFFLTAGCIILSTWSGNMYNKYVTSGDFNGDHPTPHPVIDDALSTFNLRRSCALAVGSFCIIQCAVLIGGGFFTFKQKE